MDTSHIRNFSIIAHIDHGKSTLADRMLEVTGTIEKRKMRDQMLDTMELERERGITIKMQPVRMRHTEGGEEYTLNLIDTPGHIDFSYEVSRALAAVEGVLLLVDGTQGVQAQTITTLEAARALNLPIIPVVNKIDLPGVQIEDITDEIVRLLQCAKEDIMYVSGKTGEGVPLLITEIVKRIPPPKPGDDAKVSSLIFDFEYSNHQGVILFMRVFSGTIKKGDMLSRRM
jgi:GTP-binding protein LepA